MSDTEALLNSFDSNRDDLTDRDGSFDRDGSSDRANSSQRNSVEEHNSVYWGESSDGMVYLVDRPNSFDKNNAAATQGETEFDPHAARGDEIAFAHELSVTIVGIMNGARRIFKVACDLTHQLVDQDEFDKMVKDSHARANSFFPGVSSEDGDSFQVPEGGLNHPLDPDPMSRYYSKGHAFKNLYSGVWGRLFEQQSKDLRELVEEFLSCAHSMADWLPPYDVKPRTRPRCDRDTTLKDTIAKYSKAVKQLDYIVRTIEKGHDAVNQRMTDEGCKNLLKGNMSSFLKLYRLDGIWWTARQTDDTQHAVGLSSEAGCLNSCIAL